MTLLILYVMLAALFGGIIGAILGWLDSGEKFSDRKFAPSVVRSLIAAAVVGLTFAELELPVGWVALITVFLAGAGFDAYGNRIQGGIVSSIKTSLSPPK